MRLKRPVLSDDAVTEVAHFLEHGVHEGRPQLGRVVLPPLPALQNHVLSRPHVVVEGGTVVQESTSTLHVPGEERRQ